MKVLYFDCGCSHRSWSLTVRFSSRVLMYSFVAPTYSGLDVISVVEMKCAVGWVFTVGRRGDVRVDLGCSKRVFVSLVDALVGDALIGHGSLFSGILEEYP